jgi:hypothetical protein
VADDARTSAAVPMMRNFFTRDSFLGSCGVPPVVSRHRSLFNRTFGEEDRARRLRPPAVRTDALVAAGLEVERRYAELGRQRAQGLL